MILMSRQLWASTAIGLAMAVACLFSGEVFPMVLGGSLAGFMVGMWTSHILQVKALDRFAKTFHEEYEEEVED